MRAEEHYLPENDPAAFLQMQEECWMLFHSTETKGTDMPKIHQMIESKFLKKEDAGDGKLVTIRAVKQYNVGRDDTPDMKWCAEFDDGVKPMVLNSTNLALIEKALGSDDSDDWIGKAIVIFNDENVSFGGQVTGGIRVDVNRTKRYHAKQERAPAVPDRQPEKPKGDPRAAGTKFEDFADDVPF